MLKMRENLASYGDPGWYDYLEGAVASRASAGEMQLNGIVQEARDPHAAAQVDSQVRILPLMSDAG